jgi:hypothetical protein
MNGTAVVYGGRLYVRLDGSDQLTPAITTADIKADERVTVQIKNHSAIITGNVSSPAARTDDVKELGTQVLNQYASVINNTKSVIIEALKSYVTTDDYEELKTTVSSQLKVMSDEILMKFTTTNESIANVDGDLQGKFNELYQYISFKGGCATFGDNVSKLTLSINNGCIEFANNGVVFGSWDGNNFYTGNIIVRVNERAQFGNFAYIPRSDESLMFKKVGG